VFLRSELEQWLGYQFVDEAREGVSRECRRHGGGRAQHRAHQDQMQLAQPAEHPGHSRWPCLHYMLQGHATVPREAGRAAAGDVRLHPDICRFISHIAYDGRLKNENTPPRCITLPADATVISAGTGIVLDEIEHEGNIQSSLEEANRVAKIVAELPWATVRRTMAPGIRSMSRRICSSSPLQRAGAAAEGASA
jgi:hypothetical protein